MTKKSSSGNQKKSTPPTSKDAARIQSAVAKNTGKITTDTATFPGSVIVSFCNRHTWLYQIMIGCLCSNGLANSALPHSGVNVRRIYSPRKSATVFHLFEYIKRLPTATKRVPLSSVDMMARPKPCCCLLCFS